MAGADQLTLPGHWYVACLSAELGRRPVARAVGGVPLALFRDGEGRAAAVVDRCPHRNAPLSLGRLRDGLLECRYHGWRFDADGRCRAVPGLCGDPDRRARSVAAFATLERQGFVWVSQAEAAPEREPFTFPHVDEAGYVTVRRTATLAAGLVASVENALDVPHTAFLHGGLFRGGRAPVEIEVVVRHGPEGVKAHYVGEPRPSGAVGRILAPAGGEVHHVDRFTLPSITQVEYRLGRHHLVVTTAFTPVAELETRLHAAVTFRLRLPPAVVRALVTPVANRILAQDAMILRRQTETIRRFGGEDFTSTELDVLGHHVRRLLRRAHDGEGGQPLPPPELEQRIRMRV